MKTGMMKRIAAALLALMLCALCLTACGSDAVTVTIVDGKVRTEAEAKTGDKIADILSAAGITLGEKDTCTPAADAELTDGVTEIVITRGAEAAEPTEAATEDSTALSTEAATQASGGTVEYKEEKKTEKIAYSTKEEYSDALAEGEYEITQSGADGEKEVTYRVKYVDGKEAGREKISEKITKQPVNEIITYGTGSDDDGYDGDDESGKTEVSRVPFYDCDGSGHGYWEITYDDGSVEYEVF